jgi:hypothetical protein
MLSWFDANPDRYWLLVCISMGGVLFYLLRPMLKPGWHDEKRSDWPWALIILFLLCIGRWPTWFVTRQFNEDESVLLSGAMALRHDPVFFRSVDGGTAGPLDFYALLPVGWLTGADDFFSARITALILIAATLAFTHQTLSIAFGRQVARIATLSAACVEAFTIHPDLLHYSTELVSMFLLAVAFWAGTLRFIANRGPLWNLLGGAALGWVPFAKLQAAPTALVLGLIWVGAEWVRRSLPGSVATRNFGYLLGGALAPLFLVAVGLTLTGQWQHAVIPYVLCNIYYLNSAGFDAPITFSALWQGAAAPGTLVAAWVLGCGGWILLTLPLGRSAQASTRWVAFAAGCLLVISIVTVIAPHRPFLHYCQLLIIPGTLVFGATTGMLLDALERPSFALRSALLCGALFLSTAPVLYERASAKHPQIGYLDKFQTYPHGEIALELLKYASPGEALGMWGWRNSCYGETGLRQATRSAVTVYEIQEGRYRDYFRARYLADFKASAPPVFVDAVGELGFFFRDRAKAHDRIYPEFAELVKNDYTQVAEVNTARIYVRKTRLEQLAQKSATARSN